MLYCRYFSLIYLLRISLVSAWVESPQLSKVALTPLQLQDPTDKCNGQGKSSPIIETKWTEIFNMIIMIMRWGYAQSKTYGMLVAELVPGKIAGHGHTSCWDRWETSALCRCISMTRHMVSPAPSLSLLFLSICFPVLSDIVDLFTIHSGDELKLHKNNCGHHRGQKQR
jgi:hypothetical protein